MVEEKWDDQSLKSNFDACDVVHSVDLFKHNWKMR